MDRNKIKEIALDLQLLCKKHNVSIVTGGVVDRQIAYQFDGFSIFITDGSQSKEKELDKIIGEKIQYEAATTLILKKKQI